ncbi:MAG: hypothetical protein ACYC0N_03045 [Carboxydocellales bacterium]
MVEKETSNPELEDLKVHGGHGDDHGKDEVKIYVNDFEVSIHRGNQEVALIKALGKVPSTDILYLMPNYEEALSDSGSIVIKGGEKFKSSAPSGGSS